MFCPNCSARQQDNAALCSSCGYVFPPPQQPPEPEKKSGTNGMIFVTFLLTLVLLAASIIAPLTADLVDIPIFNVVIDDSDKDDFEDLKDDLKYSVDEMEEALEYMQEDLSSREIKAIKNLMKEAKGTGRTFSILNLRKLASATEEAAKKLDDHPAFDMDIRELTEAAETMDMVMWIAIALFALPGIFTLLGGLLRSKGLTITALILMVPVQLAVSGILYVICSLVIYIIQAILCGKAKKARTAA